MDSTGSVRLTSLRNESSLESVASVGTNVSPYLEICILRSGYVAMTTIDNISRRRHYFFRARTE